MNQTLLSCLILLTMATGCITERRTYSLAVRNQLATPVSVCVTKTYGPIEDDWISPEQLAEPPHPATDQTPPGKVISPGKTLTTPSFDGRFDPQRGRAFLRVYAGTPNLSQMNAIGFRSPDRLDVPLDAGENRIEIKTGEDGNMTAVRVIGPWPATQPIVP